MMVVFLLIIVSIWAGAHYFVGTRLINTAGLSPGLSAAAWALVAVLLFLGPAGFWLHEREGWDAWKVALTWAGYTAAGLSALLFGLAVLRDIAWFAALSLDWLGLLAFGREFLPSGPVRQEVFRWTSLGVAGLALLLAAGGIRATRLGPCVEEMDVRVPNLPASLEGFRIVEICDLHLGRTTPRDFTCKLAAAVNGLKPDLVAFTGDFGEGKVSIHRRRALRLTDISARYGKFFVTGNHEYYSDFPRWIELAREAGFVVLLNEGRMLDVGGEKLLVAGITDHGSQRMSSIEGHSTDIRKAGAGADEAAFSILLSHQPRSLDEAAASGFDLMLCAHTHGGQIFPYTWIVRLFFRHSRGYHDVDGMKLYVSRGTGYWGPPIRVGSRAEITLLVLRKA